MRSTPAAEPRMAPVNYDVFKLEPPDSTIRSGGPVLSLLVESGLAAVVMGAVAVFAGLEVAVTKLMPQL